MTVFVVHPIHSDGVNIEDAKRFGEIRYVNSRYIYGDEITQDGNLPPTFDRALRGSALDFNYKTDFLLIAGDHLQLLAFSAMLGALPESYDIGFQVLRWSRDAKAYMPVRIQT